MSVNEKPSLTREGERAVKVETNPALVDRQLAFFRRIWPHMRPGRIHRSDPLSYSYNWVGGEQPGLEHIPLILGELGTQVWSRYALDNDRDRFYEYVASTAKTLSIRIPSVVGGLLWGINCRANCNSLVHGDCTLQNILVDGKDLVVLIDPGMPRGMCHPSNDRAKLTQGLLGYWQGITERFTREDRLEAVLKMELTTDDIAVVWTHWLRILKNVNRHANTHRLEAYVRGTVLPSLEKSLERAVYGGLPGGHRWDADSVRELYQAMLPEGLRDGDGEHVFQVPGPDRENAGAAG